MGVRPPVPSLRPIERLDAGSLKVACRRLARADPAMAAALRKAGTPPLRFVRPGFNTLVRTILGQQVSRASARSVHARLRRQLGGSVTPHAVLAGGPEALRAAGLSGRKAEYVSGLAEAVADGSFPYRRFARMDDAQVMEAVTSLKGFGPWSAENYMIFALGRPDVMPGADLGLWIGLQKLDNLRVRPDEKALRARARDWAPLRSAAALMLWHLRDHG